MENNNKRKETIKTVAIIFLAVLLVLTFFSNTIMNYSLVQVSTQMVESGTLTSRVRGSGVVTSEDVYKVTIDESRKIATMDARTGKTVEKGDILFTLENSDGEELATARADLLSKRSAYETAVLEAGITTEEREAIERGEGISLSTMQDELLVAKGRVDSAQDRVDDLKAKKSRADAAASDTNGTTPLDSTAETKAYTQAKSDLAQAEIDKSEAQYKFDAAQSEYEAILAEQQAFTGSDDIENDKEEKQLLDDKVEDARRVRDNAREALTEATETYNELNIVASKAELEMKAAREKSGTSANNSTAIGIDLEDANRVLEERTNDYSNLSKKYAAQINLYSQYDALMRLEEKTAALAAKSVSSNVASPINVTVTEINLSAGNTTTPGEAILSIQPENKAYKLQFSATANQAKKVKTGDEVEVLYNYMGSDITGKVTGIRKDPENRENMMIVCELYGDVSSGSSYTVSVGASSTNYDYIVPTSCIREDSNGKFILRLETKSTPLGNRYYARRVDVEVLASDDTRTAISASLEQWGEYVITTASKPVNENQQVRLADQDQ
ncbi:MAG: HlyD family efflux transporter periplasmic adaptor subunit [Lachnospiraceae bacterium]|nr:HlyD family efflux transporter periplasmic adaptor subunit [Lachnospiraceae bacterium]